MREILFKGKRVDNGEWIHGSLVKENDVCSIIDYANHKTDTYSWFDVIPETVGQFTGLLDKNGVKGFFDISIWKVTGYEYQNKTPFGRMSGKEDIYFVLKMDGLCIVPQILNKVNTKCLSLDVVFNPIQKSGKRLYIDKYRQALEIVGNIHDNPELLNQ